MSALQIKKAERVQAKLRVGLFGPSGSGKTMSALKLAYGLTGDWEKVVVIDTENRSSHLYSHLGPYSVLEVGAPYTPERYIEAIKAAEEAGFEAIVIDSITHEWAGEGGILELSDALSKDAKNSYTTWAKLTPRHNKFIESILRSEAHVICCGRSKQEYALNQVEKNGKTINVPEKMGLKAVTREGFDYEMTVAFDLAITHYATSTKDRTGLFQDKPEHIISEETGEKLKEWNASGAVDITAQKQQVFRHLKRLGYDYTSIPESDRREYIRWAVDKATGLEWSEDNLEAVAKALSEKKEMTLSTPSEPQNDTESVETVDDEPEAIDTREEVTVPEEEEVTLPEEPKQ